MARTLAQVVAQMKLFLPPEYEPYDPIIAGFAAMFVLAEIAGDDLALAVTIAGSEGQWLTLLARGFGIRRADLEADPTLRERLRNLEEVLTKDSIENAVDVLLAPFTSGTSTVIEHWDAPMQAMDFDAACDVSLLFDLNPAITVFVPLIGGDPNDPVYASIFAEILRIRAAGVRAFMIAEDPP